MRTVAPDVVRKLIEQRAEYINALYPLVDQDDYNSHLMWPVLFYTANELGENFRDVQWVLGEHSLLGRYTDQVGEFDAWLTPLSDDTEAMADELIDSAEDIKLWNIFSLENVALGAALQRGGWTIKLGERNIYLRNELLQSLQNLGRKRSGVRRYTRGLAEGDYDIVALKDFDDAKMQGLLHRWFQRQVEAGSKDQSWSRGPVGLERLSAPEPKSDIIEYCEDAREEARRFLTPAYIKAFKRVADIAKIHIGHIILQDTKSGEYIAAGFGTQVGNKVWAMPVRIADTGYQYLSDWLWQWMARQFPEIEWCTDGHDGSHLGDVGLATFKRHYIKRCGGFMQQSLFLIPP